MSTPSVLSRIEFVQSLPVVPEIPVDDAEQAQIQAWFAARPSALPRLVDRAQTLQEELLEARRQIDRLERARRMGQPVGPSPEDLRRQSAAWDTLLGTAARPRTASPSREQVTAAPPRRSRTFEDVGVRLFTEHAGKVWAALAVVSAIVVLWRERGL